MENIVRIGRNYGIGVSMLTQRPQSVEPLDPDEQIPVDIRYASPDYFDAMRMTLLDGRDFLAADIADTVIVIPNDKLMQVLGDDVSVLDAYAAANDVLHSAAGLVVKALRTGRGPSCARGESAHARHFARPASVVDSDTDTRRTRCKAVSMDAVQRRGDETLSHALDWI